MLLQTHVVCSLGGHLALQVLWQIEERKRQADSSAQAVQSHSEEMQGSEAEPSSRMETDDDDDDGDGAVVRGDD